MLMLQGVAVMEYNKAHSSKKLHIQYVDEWRLVLLSTLILQERSRERS